MLRNAAAARVFGLFTKPGALTAEHATTAAAARLRDTILAYPGMPRRWKIPDPWIPAPPILTLQLRKDDIAFEFFSTLTTLATPRDLMLEGLRIECFYPADAATEAAVCRLRRRGATTRRGRG